MTWERNPVRWVAEDRGHDTPCWIWQLHIRSNGYGMEKVDGRMRYAHIAAWERVHGLVPRGRQLDHLCRVRDCVNPDHLEPVTPQTNVHRGVVPKLDHESAQRIREMVGAGSTQLAAASAFGVSQAHVSKVVRGDFWA